MIETKTRLANLVTCRQLLHIAQRRGYAVGAFSPRLTPLIKAVLRAAEQLASPLIVQISQKELLRAGITAHEFASEFYAQLEVEHVTVPVALHLDHTKDVRLIEQAIAAGFTSVMIDASDKPFAENVAVTSRVVALAHAHGVSVEGEVGQIGTTTGSTFSETDVREEGLTDPEEACRFVRETQVDALAISVGTAHGLYTTAPAHIDLPRLLAIRATTSAPLVLHGGSDVPAPLLRQAIQLPGGGVSKINIATDLEVAMLRALGRSERLTNLECLNLSSGELAVARAAVERTVDDKIRNFLGSENRA